MEEPVTTTPRGGVARAARAALCDELRRVGPDAPTLCAGWSARDLAAHLVVRETRPDAALGILSKRVAAYTDRVQTDVGRTEWSQLVDRVDNGPPRWSPMRWQPIDDLANTLEFFVHREDLRRAGTDWVDEPLDRDLENALYRALSRGARLMVRRSPAGLVLRAPGREPIVAKRAQPTVVVIGPVGELVMFVYGRQSTARVTLEGPSDSVDAVLTARFGV